MIAKHRWIRVVSLMALALAAPAAVAQTSSESSPSFMPRDGVSDIGSFEAVPFGGTGQLLLKPEDKAVLRKIEDKHIQEMRALEDRYEKDLRALRVKQYAEREHLIKSLARR